MLSTVRRVPAARGRRLPPRGRPAGAVRRAGRADAGLEHRAAAAGAWSRRPRGPARPAARAVADGSRELRPAGDVRPALRGRRGALHAGLALAAAAGRRRACSLRHGRSGVPPRVLFLGYSTEHREQWLVDSKHRFDVLHAAHGVFGDRLLALFARTDVAINLHGEPYPTFENRVSLHLAAGHLLLSEELSPLHGLEPDVDFLLIALAEAPRGDDRGPAGWPAGGLTGPGPRAPQGRAIPRVEGLRPPDPRPRHRRRDLRQRTPLAPPRPHDPDDADRAVIRVAGVRHADPQPRRAPQRRRQLQRRGEPTPPS